MSELRGPSPAFVAYQAAERDHWRSIATRVEAEKAEELGRANVETARLRGENADLTARLAALTVAAQRVANETHASDGLEVPPSRSSVESLRSALSLTPEEVRQRVARWLYNEAMSEADEVPCDHWMMALDSERDVYRGKVGCLFTAIVAKGESI
jgi:hypothetical protein